MKITKQIEAISQATSIDETDAALMHVMAALDCPHFSYNFYPANFQQEKILRHVVVRTPLVAGWQAHYVDHHYDQIDPIFQRMRQSQLPLAWKLEEELSKYKEGETQKVFFEEALAFGLRGGFAIPVHAPQGEFANLVVQDAAVLNLINSQPELILILQLVAYYYHARISQLLTEKNIAATASLTAMLTPREMECLQLTAQYKTAKEIAKLLTITPRTVGFHIENAIKKLGVANKYQAVLKLLITK